MTDAELLARIRNVESQVASLIHLIAELERRAKRDYHDAPAWKLNADRSRSLIWPVAETAIQAPPAPLGVPAGGE
jgi:hypothetical protein